MIDINVVYNAIIAKLEASNYLDIIKDIDNSSAGATTGSEALMNQASYLLSLKNSEPGAFELIKEQIDTYLKYCKQNGLIIKT